MIPYFRIGNLQLPAYSTMLLVGMIAFTVITIFVLEKIEKNKAQITNRLLIISVFGFIALAFSALLFNSFFHSLEEGKITIGGITWLGGVLGGFPLMLWMIHKFCAQIKGEAVEYFSLLIPGIVLAHGIGRLGCFFGGCCFGRPTDSMFGVSFPKGSVAAVLYPAADGRSVPVLPTQLFEACFELLLFIVMLVAYRKLKKHFVEVYAVSYGVFRFLLEFLRGDDRGISGMGISPSQCMSLVLIVGGILLFLYQRNKLFTRTYARMQRYREDREQYGFPVMGKVVRQLRELKVLADEGIITSEQYEKRKKELIDKL